MKGESLDVPLVEFENLNTGAPLPKVVGNNPVRWTDEKKTGVLVVDAELIEAVSVVLEAHGVLDGLDDSGRAELIFDLIKVFESVG